MEYVDDVLSIYYYAVQFLVQVVMILFRYIYNTTSSR